MDWPKFLGEGIDRSVDINITDYYGSTNLMIAVDYGHIKAAEYLISRGIDVNLKDCGDFTALTIAIENKNFEMAEFLLDHGADPAQETVLDVSIVFERRSARRKSAFTTALCLRKLLGRDVANLIGLMVWMDRK